MSTLRLGAGAEAHRTETILALALEAGGLGTWAWDEAEGRVVWDRRLEEIHGLPPGGFRGGYDDWLGHLHPDDRDDVLAEVRRAMAEGTPYRVEHRIVRTDGEVRWIRGVGQPVVDGVGRSIGTTGCVADITDWVVARADRAGVLDLLTFLVKASELLSRSLDLNETLTQIVGLAVPRVASAAALFTLDGDEPRLVAARHFDPAREALLDELYASYPITPEQPGMGAALRTGQMQVIPEVPDQMLRDIAADDRHLQLLRDLEVGSGLVVPMSVSGKVVGALGLGLDRGREVTDHVVHTAAALASRAAVALENARLHGTVSTIADALQAGLAPPVLPALPGLRVAARYLAEGEGVMVGGDFYDLVPLDAGRAMLLLGDVCGRGTAAAALNAQVRFAARALARAGLSVTDVAAGLNDNVLADVDDGGFCTAVVAMLQVEEDGVVLDCVTAGHPSPLVRGADGSVTAMPVVDPVLGVIADHEYVAQRLRLGFGELLVLVTDGVLEARGPDGEFFGEEGLREVVAGAKTGAAGVARAIEAAVTAHTGGTLGDDVAIVVLQRDSPT